MSSVRTMTRFPWSWLKGVFFSFTAPVFYSSVGTNTLFIGRSRMPTGFGRVTIGNDCMIGDDVRFMTNRNTEISVGSRCSINSGTIVVASDRITIGDNVAIAEYVSIRDAEHKFDPDHGVRDQGFHVSPIEIGENCWIGRGSYIGPGVTIGRGSIVAANSVVLGGNYPSASLIAGTPAKVKKSLGSP